MAKSTKIRPVSRMLDASEMPVWMIGPDSCLAYVSASFAAWTGIDPETMLGRRCIAGTPASDAHADRVAAAISPPTRAFVDATATAEVRLPPLVEGPDATDRKIRRALFVRIPTADGPFVLAMAGEFPDPIAGGGTPGGEEVSRVLGEHFNAWRRRHWTLAAIVSAGASSAARRLRIRMNVAASVRTHIAFWGVAGCGGESIATRIHRSSAGEEPLVTVDGPLMDPELLDAMLAPAIRILEEADSARVTLLVRSLDEMPAEAQQRLVEQLAVYAGRLRLLAIASHRPDVLEEPLTDSHVESPEADHAHHNNLDPDRPHHVGLIPRIVDFLSTLSVPIPPLSERPEDIPVMVAALIDAQAAAESCPGLRLSPEASDLLVRYPWPGDFVELEEAIDSAVKTAITENRSPPVIDSRAFPLVIRTYRDHGKQTADSPFYLAEERPMPASATCSLDQRLRAYETFIIREAVERAGGNRAHAARQLKISRARIIRRLDSHADRSEQGDPE